MTDNLQPRFVRQKDAPGFFGVTRQTFDRMIRPYLTEIWLGDSAQSGIVYDTHDLNALADIIKERNGRPAEKGKSIWDGKQQVSSSLKEKIPNIGTLMGRSSATELEEATLPLLKAYRKLVWESQMPPQSLIPKSLPANKSSIRNYLISNDRHDDFIFLQFFRCRTCYFNF